MRAAAVVALVLVSAACGGDGGGGGGASPEEFPLRAAAAAVKQVKTVRATFTVDPGGSELSGEAEVVVRGGKAVTWRHVVDGIGTDTPEPVEGRLLIVGARGWERSSTWKPPAGRRWYTVDPEARRPLRRSLASEWLAVVMSRLVDPSFLLDQGVAEVEPAKSRPEKVDGLATTRHSLSVVTTLHDLGPELEAFAAQTGGAIEFGIDLWIDGEHRPVRLKINSSTPLMLFYADVTFYDYGARVEVTAPDQVTVANV